MRVAGWVRFFRLRLGRRLLLDRLGGGMCLLVVQRLRVVGPVVRVEAVSAEAGLADSAGRWVSARLVPVQRRGRPGQRTEQGPAGRRMISDSFALSRFASLRFILPVSLQCAAGRRRCTRVVESLSREYPQFVINSCSFSSYIYDFRVITSCVPG